MKSSFQSLWFFFILLGLVIVGSMIIELAPPFLIMKIIDEHLVRGVFDGVWKLALLYFGAFILSNLLNIGKSLLTTYIAQHVLLELRLVMAKHLSKLSMKYYHRTPVGETMSRLTVDVDAVNALFSTGLISTITDCLKVFGIIAAMYLISPTLCFIALLAIPAIYIFSNMVRKKMFRGQTEIRQKVSAINTFIQELYSGIRTVKAYGKEEFYKDRFQAPIEEHLVARNRVSRYDSCFPVILQIIRAFTIICILWFGAKTGLPGSVGVTVGGLAALADLIGRLFSPIENLAQEYQNIQQARAGMRRIAEFLMEPTEERGELQKLESASDFDFKQVQVQLQNVSFGYSDRKMITKNVSMTIQPGKKVAIIGRTGAGKTTLLQLIAGLYGTQTGSISISGFDPFRMEPSLKRKMIGIVPQTVHIFEGTIRDNITLRDSLIDQEAIEHATRAVGLHEAILTLPNAYETMLGESGSKLSFGQMQLLSLARAIVTDPPLLLLDEPTSGMDAVTEGAIFQALRTICEGRTIITISHRLSGIIDADEVYIMDNGRIAQSGTPDELAGEKGWYSVFKQLEELGWQ